MIQLFTPFAQGLNAGLDAGVRQTVTSSIGAMSGVLTAGLTIFVIIQGALIAFRRYDFWAGMTNVLRAACVALLLTTAYYTTWVETPFLTTLPNWIAHVVNGSTGATAGAQQFDVLWTTAQHFAAGIYQQATGIFNIGVRIETGLVLILIGTALAVAFLIWELASFMMGLVICVGPFVLMGMLFAATRPITERWISKLVGLLVLQLMVAVLLQVLVVADGTYLKQALAQPGQGVEEQVSALINIAVFIGMSGAMAIFVPAVAAYIGGGVSMNVAAIVKTPGRVAGRVARGGR